VVLAFYHHDVISGTKCKTTITPALFPIKVEICGLNNHIMVILTCSSLLFKLQVVKLTIIPLFIYVFVNKPSTQQFIHGNA